MTNEFDEIENDDTNDKGKFEPKGDPSMLDAFDFDVPDGDPDDLSDLSDDKDSAQDSGDDKDSAGDEDDDQEEPKDSVDPKLYVRAGRMGLSDEEADRILGLGSNEAISNMLDILETRKGSTSTNISGEEEKAEWFEFSEEAAEEFAPELVEVLKSMNGSTRKAVEMMAGKYEQHIQKLEERLTGSDADAFDDAIESLGKDWEPVFGKGEKVDEKSEYGRNLDRLRKEVFSDRYKGSVSRRVKDATKEIFTEHSNKLAKDKTVDKARSRQGRFIGKPAQRNMTHSDMTPRQRAIVNLTKSMRDKGMHPDQVSAIDYSEEF